MQPEVARTSIAFRPLLAADHPACVRLWAASDGVAMRTWQDAAALERLLARNPSLCWAAHHEGQLVATVLCGHDGWRGWLYHVAVAPAWRRRGIATALVVRAQTELARAGVPRVHALVLAGNREATQFWRAAGWKMREDLSVVGAELDAPYVN
jgi:ribosomal protein S18 acetylase RimI-like enzyme